MKIHVGCGKRYIPGWIHVDGVNYSHVVNQDIYLITQQPDSVDIIYASHFIEYFNRDEVIELLSSWHRVLKPNGIIRIAVPDFDGIFEARLKGFPLDNLLGPLYGQMKMNDQWIYHKTIYDFDGLKKVLMAAGFIDVRKYDWRKTEHADIDDHSQAHLPHMDKQNGILISLNVEANKL